MTLASTDGGACLRAAEEGLCCEPQRKPGGLGATAKVITILWSRKQKQTNKEQQKNTQNMYLTSENCFSVVFKLCEFSICIYQPVSVPVCIYINV